jgi:sigma-B regulation protein RsbU (phosphoserine phosphatase)
MSGQGSLTDAIEATRCGAWDYLTKPIHKNELGFSIDRCLERARLLRENHQYREHLEQLVQAQTAEIQESRERYRRLLESVTSYLYSVVVKNGIPVKTIHQQGCERVTGHTQEEFYSDPALWYRIIHEDDRTLVFGLSQHILTDPDNQTLEHRILHKDGSIRWVTNTMVPGWNSRALPLPGNNTAGSRLLYYDGIITDITRRKKAEEQLNIRLGSLADDKYKISGLDTHEHSDR